MATRPARRANPTAAGLVAEFLKQVEAVPARATGATKGCGINRHVSTGCNPKRHLDPTGGGLPQRRGQRLSTDRVNYEIIWARAGGF